MARHEFRQGPHGHDHGAGVRGLARRRRRRGHPASAARPRRRRVRREPAAGLRRDGGGGDRVVRGEGGVLRHCARAVEKLPSNQDKESSSERDGRWRRIGEGTKLTAGTGGSEKQKTWLGFGRCGRGGIYRCVFVCLVGARALHRARKGHRFCNSGSSGGTHVVVVVVVFALVDKLAEITAQLGRSHVIMQHKFLWEGAKVRVIHSRTDCICHVTSVLVSAIVFDIYVRSCTKLIIARLRC